MNTAFPIILIRRNAIRATVSMSPPLNPSQVNNYVKATRFVFWLKENVPNPEEKGVLGKVHEELYARLREEYNLPSKVAEDCYRDALVYKGWFRNPKNSLGCIDSMVNTQVELLPEPRDNT